jgi:hypothetical protein
MSSSDLVDAGVAAASGHLFTADSELSIFNAVNGAALAPVTSMGTYTNPTIHPNYAYSVSRQRFGHSTLTYLAAP